MTIADPRPESSSTPGPGASRGRGADRDPDHQEIGTGTGSEGGDRRIPRRNLFAFALVAFVCLIGAGLAVRASTDPRSAPLPDGSPAPAPSASAADRAAVRGAPHLTYRATALGPTYGAVVRTPLTTAAGALAAPDDARAVVSDLQCERVDEAADRGICLEADRGALTSYRAVVFDQDDHVLFTRDLPGSPSRTRVSADGRYGSVTAFVTGHAYSEVGFSTFTEILDLRTGESFGDLEQFTTLRDGEILDAVDRNYWGVTFAHDPTTFYATVGTGGTTYLVRGDLTTRQMTTVQEGVECPSLSPDGTRIAFKQRVAGDLGRVEWRLAVLDLDTMAVHQLAETRSVDDQPEWLDDRTVLYGMTELDEGTPTTDVWAVPADGTGAPTSFRAGAWSPSVDRSGASSASSAISG